MKREYLVGGFLSLVFIKFGSTGYEIEYAEELCKVKNPVVYEMGEFGSSTAIIMKAVHHPPYTAGLDCLITITSRKIKRGHILLAVRRIDFHRPKTCKNYIKIIGGAEDFTLCQEYNKQTEESVFTNTYNDSIAFQYHTETTSSSHTGFEIIATAYRNGTCGRNLNFRCINRNCISSELICDGHNNCGDNSDESIDFPSKCGLSRGAIAGIAGCVIVLVAIFCGGIWWICSKKLGARYTSPKTSFAAPSTTIYKEPHDGIVNPSYGTASLSTDKY